MTMIDDVKSTQAKQHQEWKAAHDRLTFAQPKKSNVVVLAPPTTNPAADVMDIIIAAVGNSLGLPVNEIIAGVSTPETISARKLAIALCVRRPKFDVKRVADHFEVGQDVVTDSVKLLDPILLAYCITSKTPLELSMPIISREWALKNEQLRRNPHIREIQSEVCKAFGVSKIDLISSRRTANLIEPRRVAMALSKRLTLRSLPEIGRKFGGRDHTTVLHAVRRFQPVMDEIDKKISPKTSVGGWVVAACTEMTITPLASSASTRKRS